jgi:hypothetical protein
MAADECRMTAPASSKFAAEQQVQDYADRPEVGLLGVLLPADDLWRHVVHRADLGEGGAVFSAVVDHHP